MCEPVQNTLFTAEVVRRAHAMGMRLLTDMDSVMMHKHLCNRFVHYGWNFPGTQTYGLVIREGQLQVPRNHRFPFELDPCRHSGKLFFVSHGQREPQGWVRFTLYVYHDAQCAV